MTMITTMTTTASPTRFAEVQDHPFSRGGLTADVSMGYVV